MKSLIILALFAVFATSVLTYRISPLNEFEDICGTDPEFEGLVPHENCSLYSNCYNGQVAVQRCPEGQYFNPLRYCDFPENVPECVGGTRPPTGTTTTTTTEAPVTTIEPDTESPTEPNTELPTTTTTTQATTTPTQTPETEIPEPTDIITTTTTQTPETEIPEPTTTATTTTQTPETEIPEPTTTTTTQRTTTTELPEFYCPDDTFIYMPYGRDCTKFYLCQFGGTDERIFNCGQGLWFNFEQQACVQPWTEQCPLF